MDRVLDHFVGDHLCLARVNLSGTALSLVLELDAVAEAELPPIPLLNTAAIRQLTVRDFPPTAPPAPNGPTLCIVDSGITANHPLISKNVIAASAVMSSTTSPGDDHGHGTMVGGLAVFGSVRACFGTGLFSSPIRLLSVRVLDQNNRFDEERLVINQIETAIMAYYGDPHRCRVFNLSVGSPFPAFVDGIDRQTVWAESLDILARKLKVLLVVSAGNYNDIFGMGAEAAERVLTDYPSYLLSKAAQLNDPATSAIAITVGSLVEYEATAVRQGTSDQDIIRSVGKANHPSPLPVSGME